MKISEVLSEIAATLDEGSETENVDIEEETDGSENEEQEFEENEEQDPENDGDVLSGDKKQSKEQDAAFAKFRKENDDLKSKITHQNEFIADIYKEYGVSDFESFEKKYKEDLAIQKQNEVNQIYQDLEDRGINREEIQDILSKLPEIQELNQLRSEIQEVRNKEVINSKIKSDFEDLKKEFTQFEKLEDLYTLPKEVQDVIADKISKGNSLKEAYIIANYNNLNMSAEQKALNKINGKSHLKTGQSSSEEIDMNIIDPEELKWYKALNPKASNKQIVEHFRKSKK